jgi:hypothetical protein
MKILVTGSTANHCSKKSNERVPTFTGQLVFELEQAGHDVTWTEPSFSMDTSYLNSFDSIVVGMSPALSVTSRWLYPALSVFDYANKLNKVTILLDSPEPQKVWAGIRAIANNSNDLVKNFYVNRKEYDLAIETKNFSRLSETITYLYNYTWPSVIYPSFPWRERSKIHSQIPGVLDLEKTTPLCFDRNVLEINVGKMDKQDSSIWSIDYPKTKWSQGISKLVKNEIVPIRDHYWQTNKEALTKIDNSIGVMISPYGKENDSWWSVMLSQSLLVGTPVVTDWKSSSVLGDEWSLLAASVEDMDVSQRYNLSKMQKEVYLSALLSRQESVEILNNALSNTTAFYEAV